MVAPRAEVSVFLWKKPKERIPLAPDTFVSPDTSPCFHLDGGVHAPRRTSTKENAKDNDFPDLARRLTLAILTASAVNHP